MSDSPSLTTPDRSARAPQWQALVDLIADCEPFIIDRLIHYAVRTDYVKYTSTLREAWRASVEGLNESIFTALERYDDIPDLGPDEDYASDPVAAFGVLEAQRHRERGVSLAMFLGLLKYYRASYDDLLDSAGLAPEVAARFRLFLDRFYDRVELGFLAEWTDRSADELIAELQDKNRGITNEKNRYLTIFESLSDPVILLDPEGQIVNMNRSAGETLLGQHTPGAYYYGRGEVPGLFPWLPEVLDHVGPTHGDEHTFDLTIQTTRGRQVFEGKAASMLDISRKFAGTVVILVDVTEREEAREALQGANTELEERVAARTEELQASNEQLRAEMRERKRAEREREQVRQQLLHTQKLEAIGTLAGGVAHDLNNLLQVIGGSSDLLGMIRPDGTERETSLINDIGHATERASSLVRQLLLFSRKQPMQSQPVDLNQTVVDLTKMIQRIIGEHIRVRSHLDDSIPRITGDVGSLEQVLMNLVVNARDAMPDGGEVVIRTGRTHFEPGAVGFPGSQPGDYALLSVEDSGVGMDTKTQQHIFEPFFSTKGLGKGTGLGLSVVYGIVKEHGGWLDVYSEEGIGTTFKVYLPLGVATVQEPSASIVPLSELAGNGERILVVEDEAPVRRFTAGVLQENGYRVHAVGSAEEALEVYAGRDGAFDVLVSDAVLPGTSGPGLAAQLTERDPELRVLFVSGYTADSAQWSRMQARGSRLLPKPFSLGDLLSAVQSVVQSDP